MLIKKLIRYLVLLLGVSALVACTTVGPDYQEPVVEWLKDWQPSAYGDSYGKDSHEEKEQLDIQFWWHLFNDPMLNKLIETAKSENHSLRIAGLRIFESRALLGIANSSLYPQLQQINGSTTYVNQQSHGGNAPKSQSFTNYQTGFNVGWELDFWGRFQRGIESADAAFFASISNQQDAQVLLVAQLSNAYFGYRTTQARIKIAHENAKIQERSYEITTNLFKSGEGSELDLQQAKTQYLATLSTIPQLEISLLQTRNAIAILLGKKPGVLLELEATASGYHWPDISPEYFQYIPANMLTRRPDIRTAAWQVAAQSAQIGVAEADFYPAISLFGTIGWAGSDITGSSDTSTFSLGPSFTWNILDYDRIENNVRIQDSRLQQLIEQYQNLVLQAAKEVDDSSYSLLKTHEQKLLIDKSFIASQRALALANIRYREGYSDFQRVLDAQRAMFAQADNQFVTQGTYIAEIVSLYKSMGGGWTEMTNDQLLSSKVKETMQERTDWGDLLTVPLSFSTNSLPVTKVPEASSHE
ncbi:MAG: TolC family protein [gamma proteobacterium symbiont of Lucinoma myriamae]|nr:TolC family protein [gamma proteobacterium symbiont of Lucinoma myriamae]MCU7831724.1 TolC family protein [gamma proteobacterium symbiont of Lucinoma myriamae]